MKCPHCHAEHQDGLFCAKCGKPLDESVSDMTRVMPPLEDMRAPEEAAAPEDHSDDTAFTTDTSDNANDATTDEASVDTDATANDEASADDADATANDEASAGDTDATANDEASADDANATANDEASADDADATASDEASADDADANASDEASADDTDATANDEASADDADATANDEASADDADATANDEASADDSTIEPAPNADTPAQDAEKDAKRKKFMTIAALICGVALAALSGWYLFSNYFDSNQPIDPSSKVKNADTIAPDTSLAEDAIVGHWRHYNTGSVIEKIGTGRYRWTIEDDAYQLDFKENKYIYEDENGNVYTFVMANADRLQLAESKDADGGLISNPVFESGYIAGRVGQDGTMTKNLSVNAEAFNIVGRTYADLAGTYGPGALSVVGDDQYIIFRADGGNFAVQFTGETVPLKKKSGEGYKVVKLTNTTPTNPTPGTDYPNTGDPNSGTTPDPNAGTTTEPQEDKEYKVEIPDMPTFPSNSAVATGVVWADLGFVIKNAPDTMTVNDLSAVLGIALEVGAAPANASGFNFYGSSEGYFAGTYGLGDHSYHVSGYGKNALSPDKTILFIQQIS